MIQRGPQRITLIAPPWYPLPPHGYGGIELIVTLLARELRAQGRQVTVYGAEGSEPGTVALAPGGLGAHLGRPTGVAWEMAYLSRVLLEVVERTRPDVIHDHSGYAGLLSAVLADRAPVVHTVHGAVDAGGHAFLDTVGGRAGLIAISDSQRHSAPTLPWIATVHNAVDLGALEVCPARDRDDYLLCLARVCPAKGQHIAVEIARRTGRRLIMAGKVEPTEEGVEYYRHRVRPSVDGDRVVHLDNVAGPMKTRLLARAAALVAPIQWPEPFGLAVVEAMASGTPAVVFRAGAMPELIEPGATGFLADTVDEMAALVEQVPAIDRERCAAIVRGRFSPQRMAAGYVDAYRTAIDGLRLVTVGDRDRDRAGAALVNTA